MAWISNLPLNIQLFLLVYSYSFPAQYLFYIYNLKECSLFGCQNIHIYTTISFQATYISHYCRSSQIWKFNKAFIDPFILLFTTIELLHKFIWQTKLSNGCYFIIHTINNEVSRIHRIAVFLNVLCQTWFSV